MGHDLVSPTAPSHWTAYHDIRRIVLFERRGRFGVYDPDHPDECKENHFPKLLLFDGAPVGVIRIDMEGPIARFRRVAIEETRQRRGHGRVLLQLSEAFAREHLAERVEAAVAADAVEFYRRAGYAALRVLDDAGSVRMAKSLVAPDDER